MERNVTLSCPDFVSNCLQCSARGPGAARCLSATESEGCSHGGSFTDSSQETIVLEDSNYCQTNDIIYSARD